MNKGPRLDLTSTSAFPSLPGHSGSKHKPHRVCPPVGGTRAGLNRKLLGTDLYRASTWHAVRTCCVLGTLARALLCSQTGLCAADRLCDLGPGTPLSSWAPNRQWHALCGVMCAEWLPDHPIPSSLYGEGLDLPTVQMGMLRLLGKPCSQAMGSAVTQSPCSWPISARDSSQGHCWALIAAQGLELREWCDRPLLWTGLAGWVREAGLLRGLGAAPKGKCRPGGSSAAVSAPPAAPGLRLGLAAQFLRTLRAPPGPSLPPGGPCRWMGCPCMDWPWHTGAAG